MTPPPTTGYRLTTAHLAFVRHAATLERCRAEYQSWGDVDNALRLERALDCLGETARIVAAIVAATGGDGEQ